MMTRRAKMTRIVVYKTLSAMGGALWGALRPVVAWAHHGLSDDSAAAGSPWFVMLLPVLVCGGSFAVVWLVATWLERRQQPRVKNPHTRRKG